MIYQVETVKASDGMNRKVTHPVANREELLALRNSAKNLQTLRQLKDGDKKAKTNLLQLAYNLGYVGDTLAGCKSIGSFFFHDIDCYDAEQSDKFKELILEKKSEIGLMMLERSASGGWHLVCRRERGKTILENQIRVAAILQIEVDTNAHDLQRVVFSTSGSEEDLPFLDDELFGEPMTPAECEAEYSTLKDRETRGEEQLPEGMKKAEKHFIPNSYNIDKSGDTHTDKQQLKSVNGENSQKKPMPDESKSYPNEYHGIPFETILKKYWEMNNSGFEPTEGDRDTLTFQLACDLRHICGKNFEWLDQVIPCYDGFPLEEKRQKIRNALMSKYEGFPLRLRDVLIEVGKNRKINEVQQVKEMAEPQSPISKMFASRTPPELPSSLPKLVQLLTRNTPKKYKPAVAQAIFPSLGTYPQKLSFLYIDNQVRQLRINCLIIAPTSSGKDTCMKQPLEHITQPMKARDKTNRQRLKQFNEEFNSKASTKEKPPRPDDLVIQYLMPDVTKAALVQRMDEAAQSPLYVKLNELEQWDKIEGFSGRTNQFTTMKLCDDEDNDFGTERAGTQSVSAAGCLHLNWNANTTPGKAIRYFRYVLTDGPISRLCLATIVDDDQKEKIQVFGNYDKQFDNDLKPYIDHLKAATGIIDCKEARRMATRLMNECAEFAELSDDTVFRTLYRRALVAVFRKACLLYVANGMEWERPIETFCRWSLFYDLYLKMMIWGDKIRHADDDIVMSKRGPRNLLELLPDEFTAEDVRTIRQQQGLSTEQVSHMISNWKSRKYISQISDLSFKKLKYKNENSKGNKK